MASDAISEQTISEIRLLSEIARANRSRVSIQDIATLTSADVDEQEIRTAWKTSTSLSSTFDLAQDIVLDRGETRGEDSILESVHVAKKRALEYIRFARSFQALCRHTDTSLLSVSGSTSYYSALAGDDLDFFSIARDGVLWIFIFKTMILSRIFLLLHPESPRLCFSCSIDESFARKAFSMEDPLFARDALNAVVLHGHILYEKLLKENPWMARYFPRLYQIKTEHRPEKVELSMELSPTKRFLNLFFYFTLGRYLRLKSGLLNRRLMQKGLTSSLFIVRSGPDHFIFESSRYIKLREMYDLLGITIRQKLALKAQVER